MYNKSRRKWKKSLKKKTKSAYLFEIMHTHKHVFIVYELW